MYFLRLLCKLLGCHRDPPMRWRYYLDFGGITLECTEMKTVSLNTSQFVFVHFLSLAGNMPARLDGEATVINSDENVARVDFDPTDPTHFKIVALTPGTTTIVLQGDAELGEEFRTITESIQVTVEEAEADRFEVTISDPQPRPADDLIEG